MRSMYLVQELCSHTGQLWYLQPHPSSRWLMLAHFENGGRPVFADPSTGCFAFSQRTWRKLLGQNTSHPWTRNWESQRVGQRAPCTDYSVQFGIGDPDAQRQEDAKMRDTARVQCRVHRLSWPALDIAGVSSFQQSGGSQPFLLCLSTPAHACVPWVLCGVSCPSSGCVPGVKLRSQVYLLSPLSLWF